MKRKLGLFLPLLALTVFAIVFHPSFRHLLLPHEKSTWSLALYSPQLFFLLVTLWILSVKKVSPSSAGITGKPWIKNIVIGLLYGITPYLVLMWVNHDVGQVQEIPITFEKATWGGWTMFSLLVFAPITEEFFFSWDYLSRTSRILFGDHFSDRIIASIYGESFTVSL